MFHMRMRRLALFLCIVVAAGYSLQGVSVASAVEPINFNRGVVAGGGFITSGPTALAVGPDGRLYVADGSGKIQALTLDANTKAVTAVQQITTATDLQEVYGIAFDPNDASSPPPIYVTNTISGFGDVGQAPAGSFPGKVTKISGPGYTTRTDIITGLPISNSGHEANDLAFGPDGRLYIEQGSSTNAGVVNPHPGLFQLADTPLSGAILVADIHAAGFNGNVTYIPTSTYSSSVDKTAGDVSVYAAGFRNPYGMVFHSNGKLYATDNGPNAGYGPASTSCTTDSGGDAAGLDELNVVDAGKYYGHANRNRGRTDARQCVYHFGTEPTTVDYTAPIESNLPASSDGIAEYKPATFGGQMQGDLVYAAWVNGDVHRVKLSADGASVLADTTLAAGFANPLAVAVDTDGTIFVAEYGGNTISFLQPNELPVTSITVTGVSPNAGPVGGGQAVTISGTNFTTSADTAADIGGAPITNLVVQNSTTITGTTSANSAGANSVTVANSIGNATLAGAYNYVTGGGTIPPVANAGPDLTAPVSHANHAHVNLDGRASSDADGFIATYDWSENGATLATGALVTVEFTAGTHLVTLTVTDNDGFSSQDQVRVTITSGPLNPTPYYCFDINGDTTVNALDLNMLAKSFLKQFGQAGYSRLKDANADGTINGLDLNMLGKDFFRQCPLVDQQIRAATAAMERYQNINAAFADGYVQITQFVPYEGRHLVKSGLFDTTFDVAAPEGLLYETDSSRPGGWRLGGAMYVMPVTLNPQVPAGFDGSDDGWHTHDWICFFSNGTVSLDDQATCTARGGSYQTNVGWLLHLWNFVPNPSSRFVEDNPNFIGLP
jgi:glucose/arabinose dehydrogenase